MNFLRHRVPTAVMCTGWLKVRVLSKQCISRNDYQFPELVESDLQEQFVSGTGPGGQKVNKSQNCVVLKHLPTGIVVKCHDSRILQRNRQIARERLVERLDRHFNGENCFAALKRKEELEKATKARLKAEKTRERTAALKKSVKRWKQEAENDKS